jgi:hypothetical protein
VASYSFASFNISVQSALWKTSEERLLSLISNNLLHINLPRGINFVNIRNTNESFNFVTDIYLSQLTSRNNHWIKKLRGLSPQANYTDRATSACRRRSDRGCRVVSATHPHDHILGFLDRSRYYFFQVAPQLYSRGWVDPVPDSLLHRKFGSAGNRIRDLWIWF